MQQTSSRIAISIEKQHKDGFVKIQTRIIYELRAQMSTHAKKCYLRCMQSFLIPLHYFNVIFLEVVR